MAGSKSDYLENKILDHVLGGGDYARPATVFMALFSAAPTDGVGGTELSGNGYQRLSITNNAANFPAASNGQKSNGAIFLMSAASGGDWLEAVAWALFDAPSGGNQLYWGDLDTPKTVHDGEQPRFPAGSLIINED